MAASHRNPRHGLAEQSIPQTSTADPIATALHEIIVRLDALTQAMREVQIAVLQMSPQHMSQPPALSHKALDSADHTHPTDAVGAITLRLYCLGRFEVYIGDQLLQRRHVGKGWAILKVLASQPFRPIHREVLIEALWPQIDPEIANNRLRVAMHHLRRASLALCNHQGYSAIRFSSGCYQFDPTLDIWCDVEAFRTAWDAGQTTERDAQSGLAADHYRQALALYRGDFLEEDRYEEWTLAPREEIKDIYLNILDRLGQLALIEHDFASAISHWHTMLIHAPWREDIYRQLMLCCARGGQRCEALHWYEQCQRMLTEQLAIPPEPETTRLYQRILADDELGEEHALG